MEVNYRLKGSRRVNVVEVLRMFLHTIIHGVGNRLAQEWFQHSDEMVSRYFGEALDAICRLSIDLIKPFDYEFKDISKEILRNSRYMPHFKANDYQLNFYTL